MFNIGGGELIVIMLIALVVLGPQRLPTAARQMGKAMSELRRLSSGFQNEVRTAFEEVEDLDRVSARRNVLAKESRVAGAGDADDAASSASVEPPLGSQSPRPARRAPLRAADEVAGTAPKNGTRVRAVTARSAGRAAPTEKGAVGKTPAKKTAAKKAAARKTAAKKPAARKPAADKVPSKGAKRTSS